MRLTVYTDYALRLLMYLALKDDGLATIAEVAESYGISKNHLMKVAYQLGVAGYVETVRGRRGGLRLAKPRHGITVGEIVRHTEPDMALVPCFSPIDAPCAVRPCCVLRKALQKACIAFAETSRWLHAGGPGQAASAAQGSPVHRSAQVAENAECED